MEDGRKKTVMVGVIVLCFAIAAYMTFSGGEAEYEEPEIDENATVSVKCLNPRCKHTSEMSLLAYRDFQNEHLTEDTEPGMTCKKCGKASAYKAVKCFSCGNVFFYREAGKDKPSDECPKCGALQSDAPQE